MIITWAGFTNKHIKHTDLYIKCAFEALYIKYLHKGKHDIKSTKLYGSQKDDLEDKSCIIREHSL